MTKPEALRNKLIVYKSGYIFEYSDTAWLYANVSDVIEYKRFTKDDVKSAVKFYKKYRDIPSTLMNNEPIIYKKVHRYICDKCRYTELTHQEIYDRYKYYYNDWLFDYCFGDVIR